MILLLHMDHVSGLENGYNKVLANINNINNHKIIINTPSLLYLTFYRAAWNADAV